MATINAAQQPKRNYGFNADSDFVGEAESKDNKHKMLPQNIDAEKSVLAACMLKADVVEELAPKLSKEDFYRPAHKIIYDAIIDLYKRHIDVDQISLAENLQGKGQLDAIGGRNYLLDLASNDMSLTN